MITRYANGNGQVKTAALTNDVGDTGLRSNFGRITDDFLRDWQTTADKVKNIDKMLKNSPMIGGALRLAVEMSIRNTDWNFRSERGDDYPGLLLVNDSIDNLSHSWNDHMIDALLMPFYGWSMFAEIYERVNGRLLWRKFKTLGHDTVDHWIIAPDGGMEGLQQWYYLYADPIPVSRMLIYRFRNNRNNPEGESILRPAWIPFYYGSNLEEIRAIGYERHASGLPMVRMPRGADPDESGADYVQAAKIGRNIRVDEQGAIIIPPPTGETEADSWHVELMSASNPQIFTALDNTIAGYEQKTLMAALAQFITLGVSTGVGTQAKADTDVSFFTMAMNALADIIADTFNKYAINRLLVLNGYEEDTVKLEHSPAGDIDTEMLLKLIAATGLKITQTPEDEVWLRSIFDMPEKTVEEIEEVAAVNEAKRQTIAGMFQPQQAANEPPTDEPESEDNTAVRYATDNAPDNAPDEADRRRMEKQWLGVMRDYLDGAQKRVIKSVRGMSR